jgi:hypothetical protein
MVGDIATAFGHHHEKEEKAMMWMGNINYTQLVPKYFLFLQKEYNMTIQNNNIKECVSYKSSITWLDIWFDKYSIIVNMGTNDGLYQVSLWDVMQFVVNDGNLANYMASDEEKLKKGLQRLSDYVKLYCPKALSGDVKFYLEIQQSKEKRVQDCALKNHMSYIESLVKIAWEKKNYKEIIDLYTPIIEYLSPMQNKRLSICKKRMNQEQNDKKARLMTDQDVHDFFEKLTRDTEFQTAQIICDNKKFGNILVLLKSSLNIDIRFIKDRGDFWCEIGQDRDWFFVEDVFLATGISDRFEQSDFFTMATSIMEIIESNKIMISSAFNITNIKGTYEKIKKIAKERFLK